MVLYDLHKILSSFNLYLFTVYSPKHKRSISQILIKSFKNNRSLQTAFHFSRFHFKLIFYVFKFQLILEFSTKSTNLFPYSKTSFNCRPSEYDHRSIAFFLLNVFLHIIILDFFHIFFPLFWPQYVQKIFSRCITGFLITCICIGLFYLRGSNR